jgi:hypothetical protein
MKILIGVALCLILASQSMAFEMPPLTVSAVRTVDVTGVGLSLPLGQWIHISNAEPYADFGISISDGEHVTGGYGGFSGRLLGKVPVLKETRQGIGYFIPGAIELYLIYDF